MENLFLQFNNNSVTYGGQYTYEDDEYVVAYEGEMYIQDKDLNPEQFVQYLKTGGDLACIDGLYSFFAFHKETKFLVATQDIISYYHPLYFCETENGFAISLSMKDLIVKTGITPKMEDSYIPEFLYNGFLTDDRCLLQGIKKVPAMHVLKYNFITRSLIYKKKHYSLDEVSSEGNDYIELLQETVEAEIKDKAEINMALSSGFDSNLLLYMISKINPNCKINAYCIGSCNGIDETESVKEICEVYPQVNLSVYKVSPDILDYFPQMVYELEDSVFERGIFLQYMMGEAIAPKNSLPTFLGEGADQLLSSELRMSADPYYFVGIEQHYPWVYFPYEMLTYIIIKKNGIFLRNRNVQAKYPFITNKFINGVNRLRSNNGTSKEHYKQYILSRVDPHVAEKLVKRPGSTNLTSLFDENNTEALFEAAKSSRFYAMLTKQPDRDSGNEVDMDNCLKILYLKCFETIFCNHSESLVSEACPIKFNEIIF